MISKLSSLKKRVDVLESQSDFALPPEEMVIDSLSDEELDLIEMFKFEHRKLRNSGFSDLEALDIIKDRMGSDSFEKAIAVIEKADRKYKYLTTGIIIHEE